MPAWNTSPFPYPIIPSRNKFSLPPAIPRTSFAAILLPLCPRILQAILLRLCVIHQLLQRVFPRSNGFHGAMGSDLSGLAEFFIVCVLGVEGEVRDGDVLGGGGVAAEEVASLGRGEVEVFGGCGESI